MTPDDLAALLKWLYGNDDGSAWLPAAANDLRLNERNLRGMLADKVAIPDTVANVVAILACAHNWLAGWEARSPSLIEIERPLSPRCQAKLDYWGRVLASAS